jgi:hypothetical protein
MGKNQGLGGCWLEDTDGMAEKIFMILSKKIPDRMFECALRYYSKSPSWQESAKRIQYFDDFKNISRENIDRLVKQGVCIKIP